MYFENINIDVIVIVCLKYVDLVSSFEWLEQMEEAGEAVS